MREALCSRSDPAVINQTLREKGRCISERREAEGKAGKGMEIQSGRIVGENQVAGAIIEETCG